MTSAPARPFPEDPPTFAHGGRLAIPTYAGERRHQLYCCPAFRPVGTPPRSHIFVRVSKKPHKVGEAEAPYTAKKPVKAAAAIAQGDRPSPVCYVDRETARKLTKDILDKRHELFRKLAQ
jgi:hypothetical protein